jgi:hypothetical protein
MKFKEITETIKGVKIEKNSAFCTLIEIKNIFALGTFYKI